MMKMKCFVWSIVFLSTHELNFSLKKETAETVLHYSPVPPTLWEWWNPNSLLLSLYSLSCQASGKSLLLVSMSFWGIFQRVNFFENCFRGIGPIGCSIPVICVWSRPIVNAVKHRRSPTCSLKPSLPNTLCTPHSEQLSSSNLCSRIHSTFLRQSPLNAMTQSSGEICIWMQ